MLEFSVDPINSSLLVVDILLTLVAVIYLILQFFKSKDNILEKDNAERILEAWANKNDEIKELLPLYRSSIEKLHLKEAYEHLGAIRKIIVKRSATDYELLATIDFLMGHRYPFVVLMLSIDSSFIDVNVHPTKMEIRFTNQMEVLTLVRDTVTEALKQSTLIPDVTLDEKEKQSPVEEKTIEKQPEPFEYERKKEWCMRAQPEKKMEEKPFVYESAPFSGKQNVSIVKEDYKQLDFKKEEQQEGVVFRIIGQVFDTYWLVEYEKELLIIDQHAAHEKVLYEKLMKKLKDKKPLTQNLIAPIVVSLSGREIEVLEENAQTLTAIGFCWEMFGDREYLITGVPADFLNLEPKQLFLELLDNLRNQNTKSAPEFVIDHCATMACKAAVKGNHTMSYAEAKELIGQMLQMDQPYHCPHGRPTTIAMSRYEFEKKFKRVL